MVSNRAIVIGIIVAAAGLVATEYAVAHHLIELPDFMPDAAADQPAPAAAASADAAAGGAGND